MSGRTPHGGRGCERGARGARHSGAAETALLPTQAGGGRGGAGRAEPPGPSPPLPSPPPPSPKLPTPPGPDSLMIRRILLGRPGRGAGSGAERPGQQADAASGARAGSGAAIEAAAAAAAAPRARRTFPSGEGNRCMGPGGRPCCAERRRRRTPQAGWG